MVQKKAAHITVQPYSVLESLNLCFCDGEHANGTAI